VEQCVDAVEYYGYDTKVMFSSVRDTGLVRNAINIGVHTVTVPLKVLKQLTENNFTTLGTEQFIRDTRLMTMRVKDVMNGVNPIVSSETSLSEAIIKMTEFGFGAVTIVNADGSLRGVFTDGDLRRRLQAEGRDVLNHKVGDFVNNDTPISIESGSLLNDAALIFRSTKVDTILVTEFGKPVGMLDIQDLED
jgi:signal-transduction protein with cAMP-binding, CBS, and nucleotidyltransferase domain